MVANTDAAAEGINLQFCWVLVNYDVPWNPARLEQRMGRVVKTLLDKLEEIRVALGSDKVFDVIGRVFEGFSLTDYLQKAILSDDAADREAVDLAGQLTVEQVRAIAAREEAIYGKGGDVVRQLAKLNEALSIEEMRRLLPGFVRRYLEHAAPEIGVALVGDLDSAFFLRARTRGALDGVLRACILREKYWLYAAFDCGSAAPRLFRVQDPFASLLAKTRGNVVVNYGDIARCATE